MATKIETFLRDIKRPVDYPTPVLEEIVQAYQSLSIIYQEDHGLLEPVDFVTDLLRVRAHLRSRTPDWKDCWRTELSALKTLLPDGPLDVAAGHIKAMAADLPNDVVQRQW